MNCLQHIQPFDSCKKLSGGNVQKILFGEKIASAPTVLLSAYAVRDWISIINILFISANQQKKKGVAVIYVGEDLTF